MSNEISPVADHIAFADPDIITLTPEAIALIEEFAFYIGGKTSFRGGMVSLDWCINRSRREKDAEEWQDFGEGLIMGYARERDIVPGLVKQAGRVKCVIQIPQLVFADSPHAEIQRDDKDWGQLRLVLAGSA